LNSPCRRIAGDDRYQLRENATGIKRERMIFADHDMVRAARSPLLRWREGKWTERVE
jgi:hypothetical protein